MFLWSKVAFVNYMFLTPWNCSLVHVVPQLRYQCRLKQRFPGSCFWGLACQGENFRSLQFLIHYSYWEINDKPIKYITVGTVVYCKSNNSVERRRKLCLNASSWSPTENHQKSDGFFVLFTHEQFPSIRRRRLLNMTCLWTRRKFILWPQKSEVFWQDYDSRFKSGEIRFVLRQRSAQSRSTPFLIRVF